MKVLQIAVSPALTSFLPAQWPHVTLDKNVQAAGLAAIVVSKDDEHEQQIAQQLCEEAGLDIPIVMIDGNSDKVATRTQIADMATQYEHDNVPPFLSDLIDFADHRPVSFTTPGHHNGRYFAKGPAGVVFNKFFGENLLYADTSDTVTELGDTMTHAGTPLLAEQLAAKVYHADKVYFCPNGTTGSNDICASAVLRPGDLVLFDRNNHKSLYNGALLMNGVIPVYMPTDRNALGNTRSSVMLKHLMNNTFVKKLLKLLPKKPMKNGHFAWLLSKPKLMMAFIIMLNGSLIGLVNYVITFFLIVHGVVLNNSYK